MDIRALRAERAATINRMTDLQRTAEAEKRAKTPAERREFDSLIGKELDLRTRIDRADGSRNPTAGRGLDEVRSLGSDFETEAPTMAARAAANKGMAAWMRQYSAEQRTGITEGTSGVGALLPVDFTGVVAWGLTAASVGLSSGMTVLKTDRFQVKIPQISVGAATWVAEAANLTDADFTAATITATPKKLSAYSVYSREFVDDAVPATAQIVSTDLTKRLSLALDLALFEGTGSSNQPTGISGVSGILTQDNAAVQITNLDPFLTAIATLANNNAQATAIVMRPEIWGIVSKLKTTTNAYLILDTVEAGKPVRQIAGVPVYVTSQLAASATSGAATDCGNAYVYQADQVVVVQRDELRLESSSDVLFGSDQVAFRGICRYDIAVPNPHAVLKITNLSISNTAHG